MLRELEVRLSFEFVSAACRRDKLAINAIDPGEAIKRIVNSATENIRNFVAGSPTNTVG